VKHSPPFNPTDYIIPFDEALAFVSFFPLVIDVFFFIVKMMVVVMLCKDENCVAFVCVVLVLVLL